MVTKFVRISALALVLASAKAQSAPQAQVTLSRGSSGTWNLDWMGVAGRTYFIQYSLDLVSWHYLPVMEYGEGLKSMGMNVTSPKYFVRLKYTDTLTADASSDDYDGDGVSNIAELTVLGTDPMKYATDGVHVDGGGDSDHDGICDALELHWYGNLAILSATSDQDGDGILDLDEVQAGANPQLDQTAAPASRGNFSYDPIGRLLGVSGSETLSYSFDLESNLQSIHE
jgi:hypothetical protein